MFMESTLQRPLMTPDEAAHILNTDKRNVLDWIRAGRLAGVKVGKEWRVDPTDLEEFIRKNKKPERSD